MKLSYYQRHRDEVLAERKVYYAANSEKKRAYWKAYQARNSDKIKAYMKEYHAANRERLNARNAVAGRKRNLRCRVEAQLKLGGKCVRCGFDSDYRALQIDHIKGGGARDRIKRGLLAAQKDVLDGNTESYQLLCANCNVIKMQEDRG